MADAHVRDLERIEQFLSQLREFQDGLMKQTDETRVELGRVTRWIEQDIPGYWSEQDRIAKRKWVEAREALLRCESVTRANDKPACSELRKRLDRCTQRVKLCEHRLRQVRQFQMQWQQQLQSIQLKVQQVIDVVEARLPIARHHLDRLLEPLRQYISYSTAPTPAHTTRANSKSEDVESRSDQLETESE